MASMFFGASIRHPGDARVSSHDQKADLKRQAERFRRRMRRDAFARSIERLMNPNVGAEAKSRCPTRIRFGEAMGLRPDSPCGHEGNQRDDRHEDETDNSESLTGFPPSGVFSAGFSSSTMVTCCTSSVSFTSNSTSFATR